jgi:hypothetical protein
MRPAGVHLVPSIDVKGIAEVVAEITAHPLRRPHVTSPDHSNIDRVLDLYEGLL